MTLLSFHVLHCIHYVHGGIYKIMKTLTSWWREFVFIMTLAIVTNELYFALQLQLWFRFQLQ